MIQTAYRGTARGAMAKIVTKKNPHAAALGKLGDAARMKDLSLAERRKPRQKGRAGPSSTIARRGAIADRKKSRSSTRAPAPRRSDVLPAPYSLVAPENTRWLVAVGG
jgi:hypothetical protein